MAQAKRGNIVKAHYVGTFEDGTVFDTSRERGPLPFTIGGGGLITRPAVLYKEERSGRQLNPPGRTRRCLPITGS